jgi:hypothetical protein
MKTNFRIGNAILSIAVFLVMTVSCEQQDTESEVNEGKTSLEVQIKGENEAGFSTRALGTPTGESDIKNSKLYIFNSLDILERVVDNPGAGKITTGLTTGDKTLIVLANFGSEYPSIQPGQNMSDLRSVTSTLEMSDLAGNIASNGLPISGEATATLVESTTPNAVTILVSRMVARIDLEKITIKAPNGTEKGVDITEVNIMKARSKANILDKLSSDSDFGYLTATGSEYWGGISGTGLVSTEVKPFFNSVFQPSLSGAGEKAPDAYFYVFPNKDESNPTMLTLVSVVDGNTKYFPIQINDGKTGTVDNNAHKFIKRNNIYKLSVSLRHHNSGTVSPETTPVDLEVTLTVKDWELTIRQDVSFE